MRRVFIEENCETLAKVSADIAFLQYVTALFAVLSFYVLIFVSVLQFSSMKTLRMRSSSMQHVGSFMGPNMRTLFRRCNKPASERKGQ